MDRPSVLGLCAAVAGAAALLMTRPRATLYARDDSQPSAAGLLRHVVMFAFADGAPIDTIVAAFDALAASLPDLLYSYERGVQSSPEGLARG